MWLPKVTWKSFLACGLGGFRLVSSWCLGFFASAVSRWCLHRLGMCSVAPKIVFLFYVDSKGDVKEFFGLRFGRFSARVQMVFGSNLHLQCPDGVCIGWACALWLQRLLRGCFRLFYLCGFQRWRERVFWLAVWAVFGSCPDGVWVFLHLQCLHGVCIGWACALWLQRLCSVAVLDCFN